jgi:transformation/transcription domain-associated protein
VHISTLFYSAASIDLYIPSVLTANCFKSCPLPPFLLQLRSFAIRYTLQNRLPEDKVKEFFSKHVTAVKRTIFSRSLRILPLPDQVGIVEGLAFLITCFPDVLPLTDQHLLAFLSEILKMLSIADDIIQGETSGVSIGVAVNRNGCVCKTSLASTELGKIALEHPSPSTPVHASKVFLRKEMTVHDGLKSSGVQVIVPPELPMGVQLRATALALFRAVVKNHPATFFTAEGSSPAGMFLKSVFIIISSSSLSFSFQSRQFAHPQDLDTNQ